MVVGNLLNPIKVCFGVLKCAEFNSGIGLLIDAVFQSVHYITANLKPRLKATHGSCQFSASHEA